MKKLIIAATCLTMITGVAFAQNTPGVAGAGAGTAAGTSNDPNPSPSPSSNDTSKSGMNSETAPSAGSTGMSHPRSMSPTTSKEKGRMDNGHTRK